MAQPRVGNGVNPVQLVLVGIGVPPDGENSPVFVAFGPASLALAAMEAPALAVMERLSRAAVAPAARALPGAREMRRCIAGIPSWCRGGPVKPRGPPAEWPEGTGFELALMRGRSRGMPPRTGGTPWPASLCGADQNGNRQTPNASSPMPWKPLPSFQRKLGWPMSVPDGGRLPLLVASHAFSVQGPLKVPWLPFMVVNRPWKNCVSRILAAGTAGCGSVAPF